MLKLQLLPDYVFEGDKIKRNVIVCTVILILVVGATLKWLQITQHKLDNMTNQAQVASGFEGQIKSIDSEIAAVAAEIKPFDDKREYMNTLKDFGDIWPERMRDVCKFIYNRAEVLSASLTTTGVQLSVRTKTTDDVARLLMDLKQAYAAGLFREGTLQVSGLTGWPNPTSPRGYGLPEMGHIELPLDVTGGLSGVGSNSQRGGGGGGGGGGFGGGGGVSGMTGSPDGMSGGDMGMSGGDMGGAPPSGGSPMGGGGGGAGVGALADILDVDNVSPAARGLLLGIQEAARVTYIKESADPPDQPYLNLSVTAQWAQPITPPEGGGGQPAGGMMGMEMGMSPDMAMSGDPGMSAAPPGDMSGAPPP